MTAVNRRERRKERTRQRLLDVAIALIGERGVYGTRIEDITERADLGKGAFYNYFDSKDALIAALVGQGVELLHARYLPASASGAPDGLGAVIAAHEALFAEHPAYFVLFHQARGLTKVRPADHPALAGVFHDYLRRTGEAIVAPAQRARLAPDAVADVAAVVLGAIAGYRSFRGAAGLAAASPVVAEVLAAGVPAVVGARRAPAPRRQAR